MKKTLILILLSISSSALASALPVAQPAPKSGKQVSVNFRNGSWGYTFMMRGFEYGPADVNLVPTTREASRLLSSLDTNRKYSCDLMDATFSGKQGGPGSYFVIDLNCQEQN